LQQEFTANQFDKLFLLLNDFAIFRFDATQRIEVLRMDDFAQNAGIEQAVAINVRDLLREAFDQPEQLF
jgi:hypothetical protein